MFVNIGSQGNHAHSQSPSMHICRCIFLSVIQGLMPVRQVNIWKLTNTVLLFYYEL